MKPFSFLLIFILSLGIIQAQEASTSRVDTLKKFNGVNTDYYAAEYYKPEKVSTSSTLESKSNLYQQNNLVDNRLNTAWVEGKKGNGVGEYILCALDSKQSIEGIMIAPGYLKDTTTWYKNNRVASVSITFLKPDEEEPAQLIPFSSIDPISITFETDEKGRVIPKKQYYTWSEILIHNMEFTELTAVKIVITAVDTKDSKYKDTCISELSFIGEGASLGQK